eukprot:CAMPEP_0115768490 /NCGR_PEP_ID=MMETSP0272-20121206/104215_1 /TAXON_ID=71861 /ORGANISM="Scrippsiella trochoidea, Strain CCMP3099" /LENGTH=86 /DNA_ID=CAMNT_0003214535 /DNA_START=612 /DNA_END=870 /DNA_ORIENTATION=-
MDATKSATSDPPSHRELQQARTQHLRHLLQQLLVSYQSSGLRQDYRMSLVAQLDELPNERYQMPLHWPMSNRSGLRTPIGLQVDPL